MLEGNRGARIPEAILKGYRRQNKDCGRDAHKRKSLRGREGGGGEFGPDATDIWG